MNNDYIALLQLQKITNISEIELLEFINKNNVPKYAIKDNYYINQDIFIKKFKSIYLQKTKNINN